MNTPTNTLSERIASLPPEKRELLERRLQAKKTDVAGERIEPRAERGGPAPLSFAQQRLWFLDQLEPGLSFYNLACAFRLDGALHIPLIERALNEIVRRHEVLRTTYATEAGQPVQTVQPELRIDLPVFDLADLPARDREAEAAQLAALEAAAPFDLARDPMLRAGIVKLSAADHVLLLTMHHIASDGWSLGVFFRELTALYEALSQGKPSPLPPLPIQYADFAVWQRDRLRGPRLERLLQYWRTHLAGIPPVLELPTDRPRPLVQNFQGAVYALSAPSRILDMVKRVARQADATLFMALLAAFKALLFRYTDETDIVVGSPVANRTRVEQEKLIGFFVNPLVLRTDLSGDPSFLTLLGRIREVTLNAYAHQELPFERLVEDIQPERSLSHNPLFQVMFALQNTERDLAAGPKDDAPQFRAGTSKFDLTLSATETSDGLSLLFEYDSRLFDPATIAGMAENYIALLERIGSEPARTIGTLLVLDETRRDELARGDVDPAQPGFGSVHAMFEAQARRTPDNVAVEFLGETLTYRALDRRADALARALRRRGLRTGQLVGLCVERSFDTVVGLLGVLKAGGAYLPLDPAYPAERLAYMLDDSAVGLVLTQERLRGRVPAGQRDVLTLDVDLAGSEDGDGDDGGPALDPAPDLACVVYTSGSTGRPKGVLVVHAGLANTLAAFGRVFPVDACDRVLQFASLNFDASLFEMAMAWHCGATLCLAPQEELMPGHPLVRLLEAQRISVLIIPPSALEMVPHQPLPDLRVVVSVGEACPPGLVSRWASGRRMFNGYGPTEISIWCATAECRDDGLAPPIGRPIPNARAYVLDRALQPVPVGVPGELFIGGPGVARGYLGRPDLTAERFLPDPFHGGPDARLYRTGDRVRWRNDGQLQYLGRLDRQVKLRGYRIELGEIEQVMLEHPGVAAAAAELPAGPNPNCFLNGFFVEQPGASVDPAALRETLRRRLPDHMVPTGFLRLDSLPLSGSGKLDRLALQRLRPRNDLEPDETRVAPRNDTEERIAAIWTSLLATDRVGVHQRFFDLGGHSLLATRVAFRLSETFGIDLPLRAIFEFPTIAELAGEVERLKSADRDGNTIELVAQARNFVTIAPSGS